MEPVFMWRAHQQYVYHDNIEGHRRKHNHTNHEESMILENIRAARKDLKRLKICDESTRERHSAQYEPTIDGHKLNHNRNNIYLPFAAVKPCHIAVFLHAVYCCDSLSRLEI